MPDTNAIICTLDEIVPHSLGDPTNRHFSLNLSVSLTNDSTGNPASPEVFQPWKWTNVSLRILPSKGASGATSEGTSFLDAISTPLVPAAVSGALESRFSNPALPAGYFLWADQPGVAAPVGVTPPDENWSRVLAHASTWPAPVPSDLNLSFHIAIPVTLLPAEITRLFIAPEFTAGDVTYTLSGVPTPGPVLQPSGIVLCNWAYTLTGGSAPQPGDPVYAAFQPEFSLQALPTPLQVQNHGPFFDFNTYWIAVNDLISPSPEAQASQDWRASLESNAADAFDLVQRVLVVLRANPSLASDPSVFPVIYAGIVAALRDNADFGLRFAPDGLNTLRFVLNRPNVRAAAAAAGITDDSVFSSNVNGVEAILKGAPAPKPDWATYWSSLLLNTAEAQIKQPFGSITALLNACDALQSAVADPATLATLLFTQWNDVLTASATKPAFSPNPALSATASTFWSSIASAVESELQSLATSRTLRSRMLQANLGGDDSSVAVWKSLINTAKSAGYTAEVTAVMSNLEALIPAWFRARFGMPSADPSREKLFANRNPPVLNWNIDLNAPPPNAPPPPSQPLGMLAADAQTFQPLLFHDSSSEPTRIPHPVLIEVGATEDPEDTNPGMLTDQSRKIAGVGLLILEHPHNGNQTFWTAANMANLYTGEDDADLVATNVLAPLRQRKRNNLKQPVLAYNSASLISAADVNPANKALSTDSATPPIPALFYYRASVGAVAGSATIDANNMLTIPFPTSPDGTKIEDWKRIPSLKFGRTYDFIPFLIGNNGALPFLLAAAGNPSQPTTPTAFASIWKNTGLTGYIRTISYNRRVAVGLPRIDASKSTNNGQLPAIPTSVRPIARDLQGAGITTTTPLLMLWRSSQPTSSFTLSVRPPSCDLETWDRWVAGLDDPAPDPDPSKRVSFRNTRVAAATALALFSPKNEGEASLIGPGDGPDLSLDDPAVTAFQVTMTQLYTPVTAATVDPIPSIGTFAPKPMVSKVDASTANTLLQGARNTGVTLQCSMGAATDAAKLGADGTIIIPEGQVWQLTISSIVSAADNNKFEGVAKTIASDFVLLIEAASAGVFATPQPADFQAALWNGMAVCLDKTNRIMTAKLKPVTKTSDWDLIHNIDVRKQAWRWMGRPLDTFPTEWTTDTSGGKLDAVPVLSPPNSRMWEIGSFSERDDDDSALTQVTFNFVNNASTGSAPLSSDDLSRDSRAQYYRFSVVVHSRYEGLPGLQLFTVRAVSKAASDGSSTPWRRCIVPPVAPDSSAVPKPKVLMALPLTQTATLTNPPETPGLLVITNEQWFQTWGLAEELIATFDQARDPSTPLSVQDDPNAIPEVGPNPILTADNFTTTGIKSIDNPVAAAPIGMTFDQATSAPLFANTSFLLTPAALGLPASGVEHMQAKLHFQRRVNGSNFGLKQTNPDGSQTGLISDGPQSDSILVEFQPANQRVNTVQGGVVQSSVLSGLAFATSFDATHSTTTMTFSNTQGSVTLRPGPPPGKITFDLSHLQLWAVVMKTIQDVTGASQLASIEIFAQDSSGNFTLQGPTAAAIDDTNSVVYLLEVLTTKKVTDLSFTGGLRNAADLLFAPVQTGQQPQDSAARVQRVLGKVQNVPSD